MTGIELIRQIEMLGAQDLVVMIAQNTTDFMLTEVHIKKGDIVDTLVLSTEMVIQG